MKLHVTPAQFDWWLRWASSEGIEHPITRIKEARGSVAALALEGRLEGNAAFLVRTIGTPMCPEVELIVDRP